MNRTPRNANVFPPVDDAIADARTLPEMFRARVALTPDAVAYRQHDPRSGAWIDWTWRKTGEEVERWRAAFAGERFAAGSRVATLMANSVAYVCVDQAALSLGLAIVPMHVTDNPGNLAYIVADSGASALIIDNPAYWARLAPEVRDLAELKRIVVLGDGGPEGEGAIEPDARAVRAAQWLGAIEARAAPGVILTPKTLAAVVYTSGTSGRPKGVMLSHGNVVSNLLAVLQCVTSAPDDLYLSFLPLSHTFERTAGYYLPIAVGSTVAFARSIAFLSEDMRTVRPTILISVPRIYERAYLAIQETLATQGAVARSSAGGPNASAGGGFTPRRPIRRPIVAVDRLAWAALDKLVAAKIRARSAAGCASRSPAARRCRRRSRAISSRWASTCCRDTA